MTPVAWTYATYVMAGLGAVALYLGLPREGRSSRSAAMLVGLASVAGLLSVLRFGMGEAASTNVYFYLLSFIAVGGAARVVTHPRPVYSALYFVLVVLATAALAVLAGAEFLAAALVIVYAGAILVTYVFVIMLAQQSHEPDDLREMVDFNLNAREPAVSVMAGFVLVATIAGVIVGRQWPAPRPAPTDSEAANAVAVGRELMTRYAVSVELAGVLLLVAMIGALVIARKPIPRDERLFEPEAPPPGEIGRTVPPY